MNSPGRVPGLDGLRGLAALYVVVHHCWLLAYPGYPRNTGPWFLGWLTYGRFAVVAFIVLSGFSLAVGPARRGWQLGGAVRFAHRRARRILPPYWAALAASLVIAAVVPGLPLSAPPTLRSVVVHALLLQDLVEAPTPNGALWSIAVEAIMYVVFPALLLIRRRAGAVALLCVVTVPLLLAGPASGATGYVVELAPLFALGMCAAGVVAAPDRIRRLPWHWLAAAAAVPVVTLAAVRGPVWTVGHFAWVDLAVGPAVAAFLAAVATGRPAGWFVRLLDGGPLRVLGACSYSLYLIHLPIVALVSRLLPGFWLTAAGAVPACVVAARVFAAALEKPAPGGGNPHRAPNGCCG